MKKTQPTDQPKPIVVLPTNTDRHTVSTLRLGGYLPVLCDDPEKVKVILASSDISGSDLLMSALHGMSGDTSSNERSKAMTELHRRLKAKEQP